MKVKLGPESYCDVCRENVPNRVIAIENKNGVAVHVCPTCLDKAKEMLTPYDLYSDNKPK
jgi:hypothetical protein